MKEKEECPVSRWEFLRQQLHNLHAADLPQWLAANPRVVVLDVRTPEEYQHSRIPGAVNLNYLGEEFLDQLLALDKEKPYLVYCRSGRRSVRVATLLRNGGFPHVFHLHGGFWDEQLAY